MPARCTACRSANERRGDAISVGFGELDCGKVLGVKQGQTNVGIGQVDSLFSAKLEPVGRGKSDVEQKPFGSHVSYQTACLTIVKEDAVADFDMLKRTRLRAPDLARILG